MSNLLKTIKKCELTQHSKVTLVFLTFLIGGCGHNNSFQEDAMNGVSNDDLLVGSISKEQEDDVNQWPPEIKTADNQWETHAKKADNQWEAQAEKAAPQWKTQTKKTVKKQPANKWKTQTKKTKAKKTKPTPWVTQTEKNIDTYETTIASAFENSLAIKAAAEQTQVTNQNKWQAKMKFLPKLQASTETLRKNSLLKTTSSRAEGLQNENTVGLNLTMSLFDGGQNIYGLNRARAENQAAHFQELSSRHNIELNTVLSSLSLKRDRKIKKAIKRLNGSLGKILRAAKGRKRSGEAGQGDVALARAKLASAQAELHNITGRIQTEEKNLRSLTQNKYAKAIVVPNVSHLMPRTLRKAKEIAIKKNPQLNTARQQAKASQYSAKEVVGSYLPQVNLVGGYSLEDEDGIRDSITKDWSVGIRVTANILNFESLPQIKSARANALSNKYTALDTKRQVVLQLEQVWVQLQTERKRIEKFKQQVKALGVAEVATKEEYLAGYRSIIDVLNATISRARAEIELATSNMQEQIITYRFLLLLGISPYEKMVTAAK